MFVVSSIPRLHTAAYHLHKICVLEIVEFPWEWNLIKNGGFDANEAGTSLTSAILFWWEPVHTNEQQESINGRSTGTPLQMSRKTGNQANITQNESLLTNLNFTSGNVWGSE